MDSFSIIGQGKVDQFYWHKKTRKKSFNRGSNCGNFQVSYRKNEAKKNLQIQKIVYKGHCCRASQKEPLKNKQRRQKYIYKNQLEFRNKPC